MTTPLPELHAQHKALASSWCAYVGDNPKRTEHKAACDMRKQMKAVRILMNGGEPLTEHVPPTYRPRQKGVTPPKVSARVGCHGPVQEITARDREVFRLRKAGVSWREVCEAVGAPLSSLEERHRRRVKRLEAEGCES